MSRVRHSLIACLVLAAISAGAVAEPMPFTGIVNGNDVYLRSGPDANYYHVGKLDKGALITVHREMTGGWYEITPPSGQFSFISADYVQTNGRNGTVTGDRVRVRAPSPAGPDKSYRRQQYLNKGDRVTVLGEQDGYLKIVPPDKSRLYIKKDYVGVATAEQVASGGNKPSNAAPAAPNEDRVPPAFRNASNTTQPAPAPAPQPARTSAEPAPTATADIADGPAPEPTPAPAPADTTADATPTTDTPDDSRADPPANTALKPVAVATNDPPAATTPETAETPAAPVKPVGQHDASRTEGLNAVAVVKADDAAATPATENAIVVDVLTNGMFAVGGKTYLIKYAEQVLTQTIQASPESELFVRAGKQVPNASVVEVLQAAESAGINGRVVRKTEPTPDPTTAAKPAATAAKPDTEVASTDEPAAAKPVNKPKGPLTLASLEERFKSEMKKPTREQRLTELQEDYAALMAKPGVKPHDKTIANSRVELLKVRIELQQSLAEIEKVRSRIGTSQHEAEARLTMRPKNYTAVGRLAASTLYDGQRLPRLYRVVDPLDGLTLAYIRTDRNPRELNQLVGQYVGVIGKKKYDPALKLSVITAETVDPLQAAVTTSASRDGE